MSVVPDPDSFLNELKGTVYQSLVQKLKKHEAWRRLAASLPLFDEEYLEYKSCPASALLSELDSRMCRVKNLRTLLLRCELHDAAAVLSEPKPLAIETQPGNNDNDLFIPYGEVLRLEIVATGVPPPRFLWYCDNEELTDQKTSMLQVADFGPQNVGEYKCLVSQDCANSCYQEFSTPVNVMMLPEPPVIQEQPEPASVRVGEEVIMSCKAVSYPPPTYEWMCDNTILTGENGPVLKIPCASPTDCGVYKCSVSNGYNVKVTEAVKLSVYESPIELTNVRPGLPIVTEKVALLIANANYNNLCELHTPYNDVKAFSGVLNSLGFKVLSLCNLTLIEMINAVKMFCNLIPEGAYVIFYFAGHGFEMHDKYMLPVECPSPDLYRRSDSLCERHVIKEVLAKRPNLLLLMLDMCLKVPEREENPGMYDEQVVPISFDPQRNLIQAYATTSNLGAYERRNEKNGIYMKHILKFLSDDMPIVDVLQKVIQSVSEESADAVDLQMPSLTINVVADKHYLTVPARENPETKELFSELTHMQSVSVLCFPQIQHWAALKYRLYEDCFHNAIEIHFHNLHKWSIGCETQSMDLEMTIEQINGVKILKILHLQRLKTTSLSMTIELRDTKNTLVDNAMFEIGHIPIVPAHLWFKPPIVVDQREDNSVMSLSYDSSIQYTFSGEVNTET